jgi:hypothetical protein
MTTRPIVTTDVILNTLDMIDASYLASFIQADATVMKITTDDVARALNVPRKVQPYVDRYNVAIDDIDNLVSRLRRDGYAIGFMVVDADRDVDQITVCW